MMVGALITFCTITSEKPSLSNESFAKNLIKTVPFPIVSQTESEIVSFVVKNVSSLLFKVYHMSDTLLMSQISTLKSGGMLPNRSK